MQYFTSRHFFGAPYKFLRAKIRKSAKKARPCPTCAAGSCVLFPQRAGVAFRNDQKTFVRILVLVQNMRLLWECWQQRFFTKPWLRWSYPYYNKRTPPNGAFGVNRMFFVVDCVFLQDTTRWGVGKIVISVCWRSNVWYGFGHFTQFSQAFSQRAST